MSRAQLRKSAKKANFRLVASVLEFLSGFGSDSSAGLIAADGVHQVNEGQEHGDDDAADDDGQKDDHDRFQEGSHGGDGVVHLFIVVVGNFHQHFGQGAGLFADIHHADDHGWEDAGSFQRGGDGFAFLDAFMDIGNGLGDNDVAGGFLDDGQSLKNGHAAADQGAQGAGETGNGDFADDRSHDRDFQLELVEKAAAGLGVDDDLKDDESKDE